MMLKMTLAAAFVASILLTLPFEASAVPGHGHEPESASEGGHGVSKSKSASLTDAWKALMAARDAIASDVESGALDDVHAKAEPLPMLIAELLEQSGDLDAAKRARVDGAAKQVTRVADALHKAADGGDAARTRKELSRLDGLLKLIRAQYPAGALDAGAHGTHGHEGHSAAPRNAQDAHAQMERLAGVVHATPQATVRIQALDRLAFEPKRIEVQAGIPTRIELENVRPPSTLSS